MRDKNKHNDRYQITNTMKTSNQNDTYKMAIHFWGKQNQK